MISSLVEQGVFRPFPNFAGGERCWWKEDRGGSEAKKGKRLVGSLPPTPRVRGVPALPEFHWWLVVRGEVQGKALGALCSDKLLWFVFEIKRFENNTNSLALGSQSSK